MFLRHRCPGLAAFLPPWSHWQIKALQKTAPLCQLRAELALALFEVFKATLKHIIYILSRGLDVFTGQLLGIPG